ncbi:SHOCT domain-containing protein [Bacillus sp. EAC]|uniref:SHOCT domain-containing protein n=1 Tax=Bacillus sp. EAC TaxID=1978338 RepID=UPI000B436858|nr:SHOCT domain-containing protein [Bacillus sp. EAC]
MRKIRVKQSKGQSIIGMIIGIIFVIIGFTMVIPNAGWFGLLWTSIALMLTIINGYNAFNARGIANYEINVDDNRLKKEEDFEVKLRKLNKLKDDGIISESEFIIQKEKILEQDI